MNLVALVYLSFAKNKQMSSAELTAILEKSRENNQARNITGLLLFRNGFFIQALEGDEDDVNAAFDIIRHDERHHNVLVLYKNRIKQRSFADWAMGFQVLDDAILENTPGFSNFITDQSGANYLQQNPQHVMTLLNTFRNSG